MLEVDQGDIVEYSLLWHSLYFQMGVIAIVAGALILRRAVEPGPALRLLLIGSCVAFLWPLSDAHGTDTVKVAVPCGVVAVIALVPSAIYRTKTGRSVLGLGLVLAGIASSALMVFNDVFL